MVGVEYSSDYDHTMSSIGFSALSGGDMQALATTIANDVNGRGGVLGRKLKLIFHNTSTTTASSAAPLERQNRIVVIQRAL